MQVTPARSNLYVEFEFTIIFFECQKLRQSSTTTKAYSRVTAERMCFCYGHQHLPDNGSTLFSLNLARIGRYDYFYGLELAVASFKKNATQRILHA